MTKRGRIAMAAGVHPTQGLSGKSRTANGRKAGSTTGPKRKAPAGIALPPLTHCLRRGLT